MRPRSFAPSLAKMHGRVVCGTGEHSREWKSGIVRRSRRHAPSLHPFDPLSSHLIGPGARFTCRFVSAVKINHDPVLRGFVKQTLIEVNDLFCFVIEKVNLRTDHSKISKQFEKLFASFGSSQILAVLPKPNPDLVLSRVLNKLSHLFFGPPLPETFHNVVFKSQLACKSGKLLHTVQGALSAVKVFPHSAARPYPSGVDAQRKKILVGLRGDVVDYVAVNQRIQIWADHHHSPGSGYCPCNGSGAGQPLALFRAVPKPEGIADRLGMPQADFENTLTFRLQGHAAVIGQSAFRDRGIAGYSRELYRQRRCRPFAGLKF